MAQYISVLFHDKTKQICEPPTPPLRTQPIHFPCWTFPLCLILSFAKLHHTHHPSPPPPVPHLLLTLTFPLKERKKVISRLMVKRGARNFQAVQIKSLVCGEWRGMGERGGWGLSKGGQAAEGGNAENSCFRYYAQGSNAVRRDTT